MKKINHYSVSHKDISSSSKESDTFLFHQSVLDHKNEKSENLKTRLRAKNDAVRDRFAIYDDAFVKDRLETIKEDSDLQKMKADFLALYNYGSKDFVELLKNIKTNNQILNDTCPNCEKDSVSSFDHLLPKSKFPEFSDHPYNLMPCCTICNGHKSDDWQENGFRKYLNLYIDDIPDLQYLFCNLKVVGDSIECEFTLENRNGIDADLYRRIENHYNCLELLGRYKERCNGIICDFKHVLKKDKKRVLRGKASIDEIKEELLEMITDKETDIGVNNWKVLIEKACCTNEEVFQFLYDQI